MRLGGPVFVDQLNPDSWIEALKNEGYRAAVSPVNSTADEDLVKQYRKAAEENDIVIAEVGVWNNPISIDTNDRKKALDYCKKQLDLAERIGANCCVNIAGARGEKWDGPHPDNFSDETFEMIVDTVREIIDEVNPKNTFYTMEIMPWIFPDSTESYLDLIKAIDRKGFAVHFDPVNMVTNPRKYFENGAMIKDFFNKLGPYIKNIHAKDINLRDHLTVHLEEVIPGMGALDYNVFLKEASKIAKDTGIIIEHLSTANEYRQAASFIRKKASELNLTL